VTPAASAEASGDAGFSLVEVLVAIVILGIAIVSLVSALAASIVSSDRHNQQAKVEAVLHSAIELVKLPVDPATDLPTHVPCAEASDYNSKAQEAAASVGWAPSAVQITDVKYWDGSGFGATCYDDTAHGNLALQKITITVTSPGIRAEVLPLAFVKE
jgi:prepilin-type N-terminal cleavage/methylation domain-containing protein